MSSKIADNATLAQYDTSQTATGVFFAYEDSDGKPYLKYEGWTGDMFEMCPRRRDGDRRELVTVMGRSALLASYFVNNYANARTYEIEIPLFDREDSHKMAVCHVAAPLAENHERADSLIKRIIPLVLAGTCPIVWDVQRNYDMEANPK
ncbi:hypothetical protein LPM62_00730 [Klebsiella pneumoniae]|nr:hypothetical protein [Klebsiella pneumoniae]